MFSVVLTNIVDADVEIKVLNADDFIQWATLVASENDDSSLLEKMGINIYGCLDYVDTYCANWETEIVKQIN